MGQIHKTIQTWATIGMATSAMMLATGCADTPSTAQANGIRSDVTDVRPLATATPVYQPPVYDTTGVVPVAAQPVTPELAAAEVKTATASMTSVTPASKATGGKSYIVRKGETLFSIAKAIYGDGKAWKKIVSANPGLSPAKLKVGQKLTMPA